MRREEFQSAVRGHPTEVPIKRQESASGDDRLSSDQAIDRRRGDARAPAGVRNPRRDDMMLPLSRQHRKAFGHSLEPLELIAGSDARQELLQDDAGDRQRHILPDQPLEKGRDIGFLLELLPSPEGNGENRRVEDDQRLLRSRW